jgi:peptidylprolyl isomerase domain and WD repeat-containing protein 1
VLQHEKLYLDHLPSADRYWKSFMHRDTVTGLAITKCALPFALEPPRAHTLDAAGPTSLSLHPSTVILNSGRNNQWGSSS